MFFYFNESLYTEILQCEFIREKRKKLIQSGFKGRVKK